MLFSSTGKFDAWKAEIAVMLTHLALERVQQPRTRLHAHAISAAIGMVVSAQSFKQVILALQTIQPLEPALQDRILKLEAADSLRTYLVGGCDPYLRDVYAECACDVHATRLAVARVEVVATAVRNKVQHGVDASRGMLDAWQFYLYQLATMNRGDC